MAHGLLRTAFNQAAYDYWTGQYGVVNVKDYGAVGDGVHDDTAAIQAAINSQSQGGSVVFPPGTYLISSSLSLSINGVNLLGAGVDYATDHATVLVMASPTQYAMTISGVGNMVRNMLITTSSDVTPSAGGAILVSGGSQNFIDHVWAWKTYNGIVADNFQVLTLRDCNCSDMSGDYAYYFSGPSSSSPSNTITAYFCQAGQSGITYKGAIGWVVDSNVQTVNLYSCGGLQNLNALKVQNTLTSGASPGILRFYGFQADHSYETGIVLSSGRAVKFYDLWVSSSGQNTTVAGHGMDTSGFETDLELVAPTVEYNTGQGLYLHGLGTGTGYNISVVDPHVYENGGGPNGPYSGIAIWGCSSVSVIGGFVGAIFGQSSPNQQFGINLSYGTADCQVINVNLLGNAAPISNSSYSLIRDCIGYNPLGTVAPPASPLVSATVYQNNSGGPLTIYQPAYATTSGTAGTVSVALGSSSTPSTLYTQYVSGATSSTAPMTLPPLRVPPGWYYSFTISGTTLLDAQIQGE